MHNAAIAINIQLWHVIIFALLSCIILYTIGVAAATLFIKTMKTKKDEDQIILKMYTKISLIEEKLTEDGVRNSNNTKLYSEKDEVEK